MDVCHDYVKRDSRVKYFRNPYNLRMPGNLNATINKARGRYIANLHDGDFYRPDLIEKWKTALDAVPTASFVFNAYEAIDRKGMYKIFGMPFGLQTEGIAIAQYFFKTFTSCVWGTVMARRSSYEKVGFFNPQYGFISDVDMWLRLARDHDVAYINEPLVSLTPREPDHPYAFVHWRIIFWGLGIYRSHLKFYKERIPPSVTYFQKRFPRRIRRLFLYNTLICVKHRRWDRVRECLAICRDADDPLLRALGKSLGRPQDAPDWYHPGYWNMARIS